MERSLEETYGVQCGGRSGRLGRRTVLRSAGALGLGLVVGTVVTASDDPTEIDACTTITEPGTYVLAADITADVDRVGCIEVEASDVTLDGNGHTITGGEGENEVIGVAINPRGPQAGTLENVTVENLTMSGLRDGIRARQLDGGRIGDVTVSECGSGIVLTEDTWNVDVEYNRITDCRSGLSTQGDPDIGWSPVWITVRHNDFLRNGTGVFVGHLTGNSRFERNRIVRNDVGVRQAVFADENVFTQNNICHNAEYGYQNVDAFWTDLLGDDADPDDRIEIGATALENYWGAANGPSSGGDPDEPFTDPETGRPADGDGDAISEGLDEGIANVRFDPFLDRPVSDVGAGRIS
jgi:hypothetical protein